MTTTDEHLERFANEVAHDLQQPLFALGGFLELLHDVAELDDEARSWVQRAQVNHQALVAALDDLRRRAEAD